MHFACFFVLAALSCCLHGGPPLAQAAARHLGLPPERGALGRPLGPRRPAAAGCAGRLCRRRSALLDRLSQQGKLPGASGAEPAGENPPLRCLQRYGQELQHNLLAEQQHILNNALHGIQATVVEKAHSAAVKPILDAKAEELTHEIVKRDKHIEARDQRIAVQDGELKVLGERLSNITKDLEQERANLQRVQQAADELAQQVDDDVLGDKVVFQRALTPELLQQAASRLSEPRGIVMCSGGTTYTINSYAVAYTIRHHHKSALPITLMCVLRWGGAPYRAVHKLKQLPSCRYFKNEDSSGPNTVHINDATIRFMQERIPNLSVMDLSAFPVPPHHRWLWHPERKLSKVTAG